MIADQRYSSFWLTLASIFVLSMPSGSKMEPLFKQYHFVGMDRTRVHELLGTPDDASRARGGYIQTESQDGGTSGIVSFDIHSDSWMECQILVSVIFMYLAALVQTLAFIICSPKSWKHFHG
ncbi:MAG TPA: hypothetical protein V6C97_36355 [Oculatellaceae cyanobacterium]